MPIIKSAKKQMRQALRNNARNVVTKNNLKKAVKEFQLAVKEGSKNTVELLSKAQSALDIAAKKNVIHKNKASRKKSILANMLKKEVADVKTKEVDSKTVKKPVAKKAVAKVVKKPVAKKSTALKKAVKKA
jgi:small subunit ribosomal protein S20